MDPAARKRAIDSAQAEARAIARRLNRFLADYGPLGNEVPDLLSWRENQDLYQVPVVLEDFAKRTVK